MATSPSFLPVIRTITREDGSSLSPADELRIGAGLTATLVTGDGPDRIELDTVTTPTPDFLPLAAIVPSPPGNATDTIVSTIALAADGGPSLISQLDLYLTGDIAADGTDFRGLELYDVDPNVGLGAGVLIADYDTTAGVVAFISPFSSAPYELAAGHFVVAVWTAYGAGVALPGGVWRIL